MSINRSNVVQTKRFKHRRRHKHPFGVFFDALSQLKHRRAILQHLFEFCTRTCDKFACEDFCQMAIECANGR